MKCATVLIIASYLSSIQVDPNIQAACFDNELIANEAQFNYRYCRYEDGQGNEVRPSVDEVVSFLSGETSSLCEAPITYVYSPSEVLSEIQSRQLPSHY